MASIGQQPIRVRTLEILWHGCERDEEAVQLGLQSVAIEGIVSIDYSSHGHRIVTCGGDGYIRLWQMHPDATDRWLANGQSDMTACVSFICGMRTSWMPLTARWSPHASMIASAHCDGKICLWWPERRDDGREEWKDYRHLSGHVIDVYDVCFSPDGRYLLSAGGDGSVVLHDLEGSTVPVLQLSEMHRKFCCGVAWDPWGRGVASFGGGPPLLFFAHAPRAGTRRVHLAAQRRAAGEFIGESCAATFRRFGWSPDGSLVAVPYGKVPHRHNNNSNSSSSGAVANNTNSSSGNNNNRNSGGGDARRMDDMVHCVYLYTRNMPEKVAGRLTIRGYSEVRGVLWAPCFFEPLDDTNSSNGNHDNNEENGVADGEKEGESSEERRRRCLADRGSWGPDDYRMALAVWTADAVVVYTTDSGVRHSDYTDLHMRSISDVAWSPDATYLLTASLDGYISVIAIGGSLGVVHQLPLFSAKPVTAAICCMLSEIHNIGEKLELGRKLATERASAPKLQGGDDGGGSSDNAVVHVPVKKRKKMEQQQQQSQELIPLSELSDLMEGA